MGLSSSDRQPVGITPVDAYEKAREWYQTNTSLLTQQDSSYARDSEALIRTLPAGSDASDLEVRAVLGEIIYGNLGWAYHKDDGHYKMAAYAHAALETAGLNWTLTHNEREQLEKSKLWPHLCLSPR